MTYPTPKLPPELSYEEAVQLSMELVDFERGLRNPGHSTFHLNRMTHLTELIGNPHFNTKTIHIAGTKGKGSVASMVSSILTTANFNVGLTTSPHMHSLRERININGSNISRSEFIRILEYLWPFVIQVEKEFNYGQVTWFEFIITMAFVYFYENKVDYQVVETGLGGRLDATNIVVSDISIITSISRDHTKILGDSILEITKEKSGIIKNRVPIVLAPQYYAHEVIPVVKDIAQGLNAPLIDVNEMYQYGVESVSLEGQSISVYGRHYDYEFTLPLLGLHQAENAMTAIASAESLMDMDVNISKVDIEKGLENVFWPARMEILKNKDKVIIFDGAHNGFSAKRLTESIIDYKEKILKEYSSQVIIVFGVLNNHDCENILRELSLLSPIIFPVQSEHPKATQVEHIFELANTLGIDTIDYDIGIKDISDAMNYVETKFDRKRIILVTGSISVAAEALEWHKNDFKVNNVK
jgi:dihydrofolate synthase/folylpolyglutamate synthase